MKYIIGVDECGYGAFAGPLVVCAVKVPSDWTRTSLKDSKDFKDPIKLAAVGVDLIKDAKQFGNFKVKYVTVNSVDIVKYGLGECHKKAMIEAFTSLYDKNCEIICDGNIVYNNLVDKSINVCSVIKADSKVPAVMAASILGKVYRNLLMDKLDKQFPQYGFSKHQGYGTKEHKQALLKHGFCKLHRTNYKIKGINA